MMLGDSAESSVHPTRYGVRVAQREIEREDMTELPPIGSNIFLENINPGMTDQGQAIFTVTPGSSGFELEVGDADLFSDVHGTVPLGI